MASLRKRTRGRILTIFTVMAVIFAMGGAVPAQETQEPGIEPAALSVADILTIITQSSDTNESTLRLFRDYPASPFPLPLDCDKYWDIETDDNGATLNVRHNSASCLIRTLVESAPKFSIAGAAPSDALVLGGGENSMSQPLEVDVDGPGTASRVLLDLENNGPPQFFFTNSATGEGWQFSMNGNGHFVVSALGTGGPEFIVQKDGAVRMGPGNQDTFKLDKNGNLEITGNLTTAGGTLSTSDAGLQAQVEALEAENDALEERLAALEASQLSATG